MSPSAGQGIGPRPSRVFGLPEEGCKSPIFYIKARMGGDRKPQLAAKLPITTYRVDVAIGLGDIGP